MASVRFNLRNANAHKPTLIYMIYWFRSGDLNSKLVYNTQEKIHPKDWLIKKRRAKSAHNTLNQFLDYIEYSTLKLKREIIMEGDTSKINKDELKLRLDKLLNRAPRESKYRTKVKHINIYFDEFILTKEKSLKKDSMGKYYSAKSNLNKFGKFRFEEITVKWMHEFVEFLYSKNMSPNGIKANIRVIKECMTWGLEDGLHDNVSYKSRRFKVKETPTQAAILSKGEISQIDKCEPQNERLENIKNIFCRMLYSGVRPNDVYSLNPAQLETIDGSLYTKIRANKVTKDIYIPVSKKLLEYINKPIRKISSQKINEGIKELCDLSKVHSDYVKYSYKGGESSKTIVPKFKEVTQYTARRTFATQLYLNGVDIEKIRLLLGHTKQSTTRKYIHVSTLDGIKGLDTKL